MSRSRVLLQTSHVTLVLGDRPPSEDAISFVDADTLVVSPRGTDVGWAPEGSCLSIVYSAETIATLRSAGVPQLRFARLHPSPRQRFVRKRLRTLPVDVHSALRLDFIAGALFESVVCTQLATPNLTLATSGIVMTRIARAAEMIESQYAKPLRLADLAAVTHMSPYHLARSFRSLVGVPPHRYLIAVRLREAVRQISGGANVTAASYAVGFSSPSHFSAAFRQSFGVVPSVLLRRCDPALVHALNLGPWGRSRRQMPYVPPELARGA